MTTCAVDFFHEERGRLEYIPIGLPHLGSQQFLVKMTLQEALLQLQHNVEDVVDQSRLYLPVLQQFYIRRHKDAEFQVRYIS